MDILEQRRIEREKNRETNKKEKIEKVEKLAIRESQKEQKKIEREKKYNDSRERAKTLLVKAENRVVFLRNELQKAIKTYEKYEAKHKDLNT